MDLVSRLARYSKLLFGAGLLAALSCAHSKSIIYKELPQRNYSINIPTPNKNPVDVAPIPFLVTKNYFIDVKRGPDISFEICDESRNYDIAQVSLYLIPEERQGQSEERKSNKRKLETHTLIQSLNWNGRTTISWFTWMEKEPIPAGEARFLIEMEDTSGKKGSYDVPVCITYGERVIR